MAQWASFPVSGSPRTVSGSAATNSRRCYHVQRTKKVRRQLRLELIRRQLLKETGEEVARRICSLRPTATWRAVSGLVNTASIDALRTA
jgi:hypothetical protein